MAGHISGKYVTGCELEQCRGESELSDCIRAGRGELSEQVKYGVSGYRDWFLRESNQGYF